MVQQFGTDFFVQALTAKFSQIREERFPHMGSIEVAVQPGRAYDRIVLVENGQVTSAHAFVRRADQALIKSATWAKPQRSRAGEDAVRFSLADEAGTLAAIDAADESGSYLYAR